ncbi:MAG: chemotaxis-specific protein-glutamate methyltransferase CheB [Desulfobaccales bacterium]
MSRISVLVVEDSPVVRDLITYILGSDPEIAVIGAAASGEDAVTAAARLRPDVITMDINLPGINGYEATRRIMETSPTRVIIVSSSYDPQDVAKSLRVVEAGALSILPPPLGIGHPQFRVRAAELIRIVKLMSEIKVVRRWPKTRAQVGPAPRIEVPRPTKGIEVVAMGASTGGPVVLKRILQNLGPDFSAPLLIVQHMSPGFVPGLAEWLRQTTAFPVQVAQRHQEILAGQAYLAPDGWHMEVDRWGRIELSEAAPLNGLRPAIAPLFRSVAQCYGPRAVGILLTGMGDDGVAEMGLMKEKGAITIAQDQESSVVHGIPGQAIKLGAAMYVLDPEQIAALLKTLIAPDRKAQRRRGQ